MKRVFVIEDDRLMREVLVRRLVSRNLDVTPFSDAVDAVDPIVIERPDMVLTDFRMPRMSGIELVRRLRAQGIGVPVIMVTADPSSELVDQAHVLGILHVFKKPLGGSSPLWDTIDAELVRYNSEALDVLDGLRLELLTDLSHQLRTPLTATKLAMEGLLSELDDSMDGSQKRLASISRRNIDRLVALVEGQLETLQKRVRDGMKKGGGGVTIAGMAPVGRRSRD